jgi:hypothetical protein
MYRENCEVGHDVVVRVELFSAVSSALLYICQYWQSLPYKEYKSQQAEQSQIPHVLEWMGIPGGPHISPYLHYSSAHFPE